MAQSSKALTTVDTADIKTRLSAARRTVSHALQSVRESTAEHSREYLEWKTRASRASRILTLTKSKEAREDLKVLLEQAESYRNHFGAIKVKEDEYEASLAKQMNALDNAFARFENMERKQNLKKDIARLAGKGALEAMGSIPSIDFSEIDRIIHTATALIELKEDKGITT